MFKKTGAATAGSISRLAQRERMCFFVMALGGMSLGMTEPLSAETLLSALARAYAGNPDLNQSRAAVRVRDEDMPKALAGKRPRVNIQASVGPLYGNLRLPFGRNAMTGQRQVLQEEYSGYPRGVQNGATTYMNLLRDTAIVNLRKNNIAVLEQQLKQTRDRFQVGEVTRTDVAQAEASVAQARSELRRAGAAEKQHRHLPSDYRRRAHAFGAGALARAFSTTLAPASDRDCARRTSGRHRRAASGGCGGIRGEGRRERAGAHAVSERPGFPAMGFLSGHSRIAPILRRCLRSAQCAAVSGRLRICLDPPGKRAIEPSAAQC